VVVRPRNSVALSSELSALDLTTTAASDALGSTTAVTSMALSVTMSMAVVASINAFRVRENHLEVIILEVLFRRLQDVPRTRRKASVDRAAMVSTLTRRELAILNKGFQSRNEGIEGLEFHHLSILDEVTPPEVGRANPCLNRRPGVVKGEGSEIHANVRQHRSSCLGISALELLRRHSRRLPRFFSGSGRRCRRGG